MCVTCEAAVPYESPLLSKGWNYPYQRSTFARAGCVGSRGRRRSRIHAGRPARLKAEGVVGWWQAWNQSVGPYNGI